jgi:dTDP-4-dehydrorhamnose reductase
MDLTKSKIAVLGSEGMLGYAVSRYMQEKGYNISAVNRNDFDVLGSPINSLGNILNGCAAVINCIGVVKQIIHNFRTEDVLKINSVFPRNLSVLCNRLKIKLIHITTDCVYSGLKGNYTENDYYDAEDLYGISKLSGEPSDCMVLRTSIIGVEKKTSHSLIGWAIKNRGNKVNGFTNHYWNGVTTLQFAKISETILKSGLYSCGIFHIFSPDKVSKYELLVMINDVFELGLEITPFATEVICDRSLSSVHDLSAKVSFMSIKQQLQEIKEFFGI